MASPSEGAPHRLPPGQYVARGWPVLHYGRVPRFKPERWDFRVYGATADEGVHRFTLEQIRELPQVEQKADFHCVTKFSVLDNLWGGFMASSLVSLVPPSDEVTGVIVWAEYGYSANITLEDFLRPTTMLVHRRNGADITPEHGWPLRLVVPHLYGWKSVKWVRAVEYVSEESRGFWEERGYHNRADPWREQRYSYQEDLGDGPPLMSTPAPEPIEIDGSDLPDSL